MSGNGSSSIEYYPVITLALSPASVAEDGTANLIYTFTRTGSTTSPLTVNYTVAGTATNGSDFTGISTAGTIKTVSFAAGSATATVIVNPTADTTVEANETVALALAAGTGYSIGTTAAVTGTITNDDLTAITPPPQPSSVYVSDLTPIASINGWGSYERDRSNGGTATGDGRTLTLNGVTYAKGLGVHAFSSLTYSLGGGYSRFQSFIGLDDYVPNGSGSVVFRVLADGAEIFRSGILNGSSATQFVDLDVAGRQSLQLIADAADGSIVSDHANWADARLLLSSSPATPLPSISLAVSPASVAEDGTANLIYTFTRTGSTTSPLTVNYTVAGTATNGSDFTGISTAGTIKTVSFAAGSATATVIVNPTADTTVEANETVALALAAGTGYSIGTTAAVTGTITNDDLTTITNGVTLPSRPTTGWTVNQFTVGLAPFGIEGESLPVYTGPYEIPAGSVITGMRFTSPVSLHQGNIIIERSLFQPTSAGSGLPIVTTTNYNNWAPARGRVIIRDSEIDGSLLPSDQARAFSTGFIGIADLQRNYIHNVGSGIGLYNTGRQLDALIEHNYVDDLVSWGNGATTGNHSSAFTIRDFTDADRPDRVAIIRNNHFNADSANTTSALFIAAQEGRIDNLIVAGNLLAGNSWNLAAEPARFGYNNVSVTNNRFAPSPTAFGAAYGLGSPWAAWQDNFRYNPAMPDGMGSAVLP